MPALVQVSFTNLLTFAGTSSSTDASDGGFYIPQASAGLVSGVCIPVYIVEKKRKEKERL
jgi:hypothetical protein